MAIRLATAADIIAIHECHDAAILEKASETYNSNIIQGWMSYLNPDKIAKDQEKLSRSDFLCVVYEEKNMIYGFAMVDYAKNYLNAIYVRQGAKTKNLGTKILDYIKLNAQSRGVTTLWFEASVNARDFYVRGGAVSLEETSHTLDTGQTMPCIKMRLDIT